jgi:hypothetical protein
MNILSVSACETTEWQYPQLRKCRVGKNPTPCDLYAN